MHTERTISPFFCGACTETSAQRHEEGLPSSSLGVALACVSMCMNILLSISVILSPHFVFLIPITLDPCVLCI